MPKQPAKKSSKKKGLKKNIFYFFSLCAAVFVLLISGLNIATYLDGGKREAVVLGITTEDEEKLFWVNFLNDNPSYIVGWIELAKLESKLGSINGAKEAIDKAEEIDPNSEIVKAIKEGLD